MTDVVAWYAVGVGVLMAVWWTLELRRGALNRPDRAPAEIRLHLAAELTTSALLVGGGAALLIAGISDLLLVALGMLLYSVVQSPGYFLSRHEPAPAWMFAGLAGLTLASIVSLLYLR